MKKTIEKINETKSWYFEKINKIDKPLARLIKKKRERIQINKIRNKQGDVTTNSTEIQRLMRDYHMQLYANKMDNLEDMDKFLDRYNLPRLSQEEVGNMNRPITNNETETVIKKTLNEKKSSTRWLHRQILSNIQEELTSILLKLFQKITEEGTLPNSFYEATINLIPKPKNHQKRKL